MNPWSRVAIPVSGSVDIAPRCRPPTNLQWALVGALTGACLVVVLRLYGAGGWALPPTDAPRRDSSVAAAPTAAATPSAEAAPTAGALGWAQAAVVFPVTHPAPPPARGKTLEREAADAVHAGDHRRAASLYRELAARHPQNEAFAAAARILGF